MGKNVTILGALSLVLAPSLGVAQSHGDHVIGSEAVESHASHASANEGEVLAAEAADALTIYRDALVALDLEAAGSVFAEDSLVFENGKAEGSWADYAEHHLGPELGHFHTFAFPTYEVEIRQEGRHLAVGVEHYTYRIELHDGRVVEREGVATSVLRHDSDGWKIVSYHSSSRAPRP